MTILAIGDKHYPLVGLRELQQKMSLRQQMVLQRELAVTNISSCRTMKDILLLLQSIPRMTKGAIADHPEGMFLIGVMVWASRVCAGEDISLLEAVDVPFDELRFIEDGEELDRDEELEEPGKA